MINILHVIHKYRGDYSLLNQQVNLDSRRFRTIVCFLSGKDDGKNQLEVAGHKTIYLNLKSKTLRFHNFPLLLRLKKIVDDENIHIINCQQHRSTPVGVLAALLSNNCPTVLSTLHGLGNARTYRRKVLNWLFYRKIFRIVGISEGVSIDIVDSNWGLSPVKVTTVQNGLVYDRFLSGPSKEQIRQGILAEEAESFWFGTVGRLSEVKNHRTLVRAFRRVVDAQPSSRLLIAGDGELQEELACLVADLGLERNVFLLGFRSDIPEFLRSLDVFVLPSLREGLPLALLEAMATGLPVIGSRVGGIPEVVSGGDFGTLVESCDIDEMAAAMVSMINLPAHKLALMGEAARDRAVNKFSSKRMIEGYERVYGEAYSDWQKRMGK